MSKPRKPRHAGNGPDLVDRVEKLLTDFEEVGKLIHAPNAPVTEDEIIAFESAHNRVRHYLSGWGS